MLDIQTHEKIALDIHMYTFGNMKDFILLTMKIFPEYFESITDQNIDQK